MGRLYKWPSSDLPTSNSSLARSPCLHHVAALLADAQQRIDALDNTTRIEIPAFVPSNFELVYLRARREFRPRNLATGRRFIEWGSGIGVVTCLASCVGFDAVGIEIEPKLVEHRQ